VINVILLLFIWLLCTVVAGAYIGFIGAIAWRIMQWLQ